MLKARNIKCIGNLVITTHIYVKIIKYSTFLGKAGSNLTVLTDINFKISCVFFFFNIFLQRKEY